MKTIQDLETAYSELRAKAQKECAAMIEYDARGNAVAASAHRGRFVRLSNEADIVYEKLQKLQVVQLGGID